MSSAKIRTHYDNLKVARDAPDIVIRDAYRSLSQRYHPDKSPSDADAARVMTLINESCAVRWDPERRRRRDEWIAREELKIGAQVAPPTPPIPPAWQEPPLQRQTPQRTPAKPEQSLGLLRGLATLVVKILLFSPRLTFVALLVGGIWLWGELAPPTQKRAPPPGPKPYQAMATRNTSAVFVKLVSIDGAAYPVRQFYIPGGSRFTLKKVDPGTYDLITATRLA